MAFITTLPVYNLIRISLLPVPGPLTSKEVPRAVVARVPENTVKGLFLFFATEKKAFPSSQRSLVLTPKESRYFRDELFPNLTTEPSGRYSLMDLPVRLGKVIQARVFSCLLPPVFFLLTAVFAYLEEEFPPAICHTPNTMNNMEAARAVHLK